MKFHATNCDLIIKESERLISGSVNIYTCEFTFDSSWDDYLVTAVFSTASKLINVAIVDGKCDIPVEVLKPNSRIRVGVFGNDGVRTRPTTYSAWIPVEQGADVKGRTGRPPETTVYEQWMNALDDKHDEWNEQEQARAEAEAERVEAEAEREQAEAERVLNEKMRIDKDMTVSGTFVPSDEATPAVEKSFNANGSVNLHFNFPSAEGAGDMMGVTYDPQRKAQDIFKYADDAAEKKSPFILTYGGDNVVSYKKVDLKLFQDVVDSYMAGRPVILHRWANNKLHQSSLSMSDYTSTKDVLIFREPMESGNSANCRFIRDNEEGYVQWTRETKYPTPAEHTHDPASIGAAVTKTYTVTVPTGWKENDDGGFYQYAHANGLNSSDNPIVDVVLGYDVEANKLQMEAWAKVDRVSVTPGAKNISLYAYGDPPAVQFQIQLKVVR